MSRGPQGAGWPSRLGVTHFCSTLPSSLSATPRDRTPPGCSLWSRGPQRAGHRRGTQSGLDEGEGQTSLCWGPEGGLWGTQPPTSGAAGQLRGANRALLWTSAAHGPLALAQSLV